MIVHVWVRICYFVPVLPTGLSIDQDKSIQKLYLTWIKNYDFVLSMVLAAPIAQLKMIGFRQKRQDDRKEKKFTEV